VGTFGRATGKPPGVAGHLGIRGVR
jgi:hypothetical protein